MCDSDSRTHRNPLELWDDAPESLDLRDKERVRFEIPDEDMSVLGISLGDTDWVESELGSIECLQCRQELYLVARRWLGSAIVGENLVGGGDGDKIRSPFARKCWLWKFLCPVCECPLLLASRAREHGSLSSVRSPLADYIARTYVESEIMTEESLEKSLERVME